MYAGISSVRAIPEFMCRSPRQSEELQRCQQRPSDLRRARFQGGNGTISVSEQNWLEIIEEERVRELYMEGFRLQDLKRWHKGFERKPQEQSLTNGSSLKIEADDVRFVWPIPKHELESPGSQIQPNESNK